MSCVAATWDLSQASTLATSLLINPELVAPSCKLRNLSLNMSWNWRRTSTTNDMQRSNQISKAVKELA